MILLSPRIVDKEVSLKNMSYSLPSYFSGARVIINIEIPTISVVI